MASLNDYRTVKRDNNHQDNRDSSSSTNAKFDVSSKNPIHILFPLPKNEGKPEENPFGITISLAEPIIDIAFDEVYQRSLVPKYSLIRHIRDTNLSDAIGPNVAIAQLVRGELDCIIGYAFVYALAPVARMSPYWGQGIPVITSIGLTSNLDDRKEYALLTRITSPYKVVTDAIIKVFDQMNWLKVTYLFNEQRHGSSNAGIPYGECYLLMASLQRIQYKRNKMEHNYFMFNEKKYDSKQILVHLMKASEISNALAKYLL
ncbi:unnamed protein product [Dracunculus medinensis]|uniref:ANF_receptor domain-containing protein n=1 Tax=Dracunculus medinensis TaxID=318479 RepID=A0A0N4U7C0_DRAME|nr:unnamed protein product [Dracunculus medinensis]